MSKFFASDSEFDELYHDDFYIVENEGIFQELTYSSQESFSEEESFSSEQEQHEVASSAPVKKSFFDVSDSESEDEVSNRLIVSQKSKYLSELTSSCASVISLAKSRDFSSSLNGNI